MESKKRKGSSGGNKMTYEEEFQEALQAMSDVWKERGFKIKYFLIKAQKGDEKALTTFFDKDIHQK